MSSVVELDRQVVVVDVGCRWGFSQHLFEGHNRDCFRIYGFDADAAECARLNEHYVGYPVRIFPLALAGRPGRRTLHHTREPACSSLLRPRADLTSQYPALGCAALEYTSEIEVTTLDDWAAAHAIPVVDYLKLDTQGTELEILQGGLATLRSVRALEVEVEFNPIYESQPLFAEVDAFLRGQGFVLWKLANHVHYTRHGTGEDPLGENLVFWDDRHGARHPSYEGQLFWANAHYVRQAVLDQDGSDYAQRDRDTVLFETLGQTDVLRHFQERPGSPP